MSCARMVGMATLIVTLVVVISGGICMVWSRVGMTTLEVMGPKDMNQLSTCLREVQDSVPGATGICDEGGYVCNPGTLPGPDGAYLICGIPPTCFCLMNPADQGIATMLHASNISELLKLLLNVTGWLNFSAGAAAVIGVIPVLIGAIGKVTGNDNLAVACGATGIAFEVCCGLISTWTFASAAFAIGQLGYLLGFAIWETETIFNNITNQPGLVNYCPQTCKDVTNNIRTEWMAFGTNVSSASGLAFFAAGVSILALILTCVGFCIQKQAARGPAYIPPQQQTTVTTYQKMGDGTAAYQVPAAVPTATAVIATTEAQPLNAKAQVAYPMM